MQKDLRSGFNIFEQLNGLESKKPESGNPATMEKTETLAETGGFLNLLVKCRCN